MRKDPLVTGEVYHLMNKSIAGYQIFKVPSDYEYMVKALRYFSLRTPPNKFSYFLKRDIVVQSNGFDAAVAQLVEDEGQRVQIVAYCLMPTHIHIVAKQLMDKGITRFMSDVLNTYARYFNVKHERKGPLWMGRFKNVTIEDDDQLLHVVRYNHLNPTTAALVGKAEEWPYSSYSEYIASENKSIRMVNYEGFFNLTTDEHRAFTEDAQDYQRSLALIKHQLLD